MVAKWRQHWQFQAAITPTPLLSCFCGLAWRLGGHFLSSNQPFHRWRPAAALPGREELTGTSFLPHSGWDTSDSLFAHSCQKGNLVPFVSQIKTLRPYKAEWLLKYPFLKPKIPRCGLGPHAHLHLTKRQRLLTQGPPHLRASETAETEEERMSGTNDTEDDFQLRAFWPLQWWESSAERVPSDTPWTYSFVWTKTLFPLTPGSNQVCS